MERIPITPAQRKELKALMDRMFQRAPSGAPEAPVPPTDHELIARRFTKELFDLIRQAHGAVQLSFGGRRFYTVYKIEGEPTKLILADDFDRVVITITHEKEI